MSSARSLSAKGASSGGASRNIEAAVRVSTSGERVILLVDDGLATGSTMRAAVNAIRQEHPKAIVFAVPVAAPQACAEFQDKVEEIVCLHTPDNFSAVGSWYRKFPQTTDDDVWELLGHDTTRRDPHHAYAGCRR